MVWALARPQRPPVSRRVLKPGPAPGRAVAFEYFGKGETAWPVTWDPVRRPRPTPPKRPGAPFFLA